MALYQFVIEFIPTKWVEENKLEAIDILYDNPDKDNNYDTSIAWKEFSLLDRFDFLVSRILPLGKTWDSNLRLWGESDKNDLQLWLEKNKVESIKIRLDLRDNINEIKTKLIDLAKVMNCSLFIPEFKVIISANVIDLNNLISKSRAARFLYDPEKFLDSIAK